MLFLIVLSGLGFAQESERNLLVLEGHVLTADSLLPVPKAHIISKMNAWGTISHDDGSFIMYVSPLDSVLFTSIGFAPRILYVDSSVMSNARDYNVLMAKDTVMINEVVIQAFWDYETLKMLITTMDPQDLDAFYPEWEGTELLYKNIQPAPIGGPIQGLYNVFNRQARLKRKLIRNRKNYNKIMIQMGRPEDTIPATPEHMQELPY
ncbi:MAG: hypothetical protein P8100_07950 [bacterium]